VNDGAGHIDEVTAVYVDRDGTLWAALVYLAAVAYPDDHAGRDRFIEAMKSWTARYASKAKKPTFRPPMKRQQQDGSLRRGFDRLRHRINMAEILSAPLIAKVSKGLAIQVSGGGSVTARLGGTDVYKQREAMRHWTATKPVLHLALSLRAAKRGRRWSELLTQPEWINGALVNAECHAMLLRNSGFVDCSQVRLVKR
jgi:hypothetical protein